MTPEKLLEIENLTCGYRLSDGYEEVLSGAFLTIDRGEIVGLKGRSGSGKSTLTLAILGLLKETGGEIKEGRIQYKGKNGEEISINQGTDRELEAIRGKEISLVFQNPALALNPLVKIGRQLERCCPKEEISTLIDAVGLGGYKNILAQYPHQLSIGMCQRVTIALAIGRLPALLILDEPTASLDSANKKKVLDLLMQLNQKFGTSLLITTHDLEALEYMKCKVYNLEEGKIKEIRFKNEWKTVAGSST